MIAKIEVATVSNLRNDHDLLWLTSNSLKGGDPCQALLFVAKNGISDGSTYKFIGKNGTCMRSKYPAKTFFKRPCGQENNGDEKLMQRVLAGHGPLIVYLSKLVETKTVNSFNLWFFIIKYFHDIIWQLLLDLAGTGFEQYKSGIFQSTKCSKKLDKADFAMVNWLISE